MDLPDSSSNTSKETFVPGAQPSSELGGTRMGHRHRVATSLPAQGSFSGSETIKSRISGVPPLVAAGMVGIISIAKGLRRLLWAWLSDAVGRPAVFLIMFLLQAMLFFFLPAQRDFAILVTLAFVILSCYGGCFGTMPAFATYHFWPKFVGSIYGLMLTAWGFGGLLGPLLIARIREATGRYSGALIIIASVMLVSSLLPLAMRGKNVRNEPVRAT